MSTGDREFLSITCVSVFIMPILGLYCFYGKRKDRDRFHLEFDFYLIFQNTVIIVKTAH